LVHLVAALELALKWQKWTTKDTKKDDGLVAFLDQNVRPFSLS
jgi:hypothetical protein